MPQTNEHSLEKIFSDLAYNHLRDKSQGILDYFVGFQLLKQEDDGKRAVGIFGFEIDGDFYYVPCFFLNGEIRGLDSLYSVKSDLFVPLTESWVDSIIERRQTRLGDPDTRSRGERGVKVPNYSKMRVLPSGAGGVNLKLGEVIGDNLDTDLPNRMCGDRGDNLDTDLPELISQAGATQFFKQAMAENPRLRDHFEAFGYSLADLYDPQQPQRKQAEDSEPVVIINSVTDEGVDELTDEQRQQVLEGGTVVLDKRPEVAKAQAYKSETTRELENPTAGGLYDVLWADGTTTTCLIAQEATGDNAVFVYCPDTKKYCCVPSRKVFTLRRYSREEMLKWLDENGTTPSELRPNDVAVFVSHDGESTAAFCLKDKRVGVDDITAYSIFDPHNMVSEVLGASSCGTRGNNGNPQSNTFAPIPDREEYRSHRQDDANRRVKEVLVTESGGTSPRYTQVQCIVNDRHFVAIKLNSFRLEETEYGGQLEHYTKSLNDMVINLNQFGDYNTVHQAMDKIASDMKVWRHGGETNIKVAGDVHTFRSEGDGLQLLVGQYGLGEGDARAIIKEADLKPTIYKYAATTKEASEMLMLPDAQDLQDLGGGFMNAFQPEQSPFSTYVQAQPRQNREFYQYHSPFGSGDGEGESNTLEVVDEAAQTGQKDVFDAAALGSLIKSHTPTDLVDRFLPTITAGMDRVGRMLFLIFWHYEDFEDRYGEGDLSEFIDNLRSVFEQLGDVVIFSKKRTLAGDPEHYGMEALPVMQAEY